MEKRVFFDNARTNVLEFFTQEFPSLTIEQVDAFVSVFYRLANYEEEGQKIKPTILISNNINSVVRSVPNCKKIVFYEDKDLINFKARIKALMCFCKADWNIYVNFGEESVEFGVVKRLSSIKEQTMVQYLSQSQVMENLGKRLSLVILSVIAGSCRLMGANGNTCAVHFNLNSSAEYDWDNETLEFVDACVSKIKTTQKKLADIKTLITNIFHRVLRELHGTICVVVDKDFKDTTGFLADGTWLKEPIEFGKLFLRSSTFDENVLRSYADVLTTMLNYDGITVVDNAGRIRAYNIFIESNASDTKIVGGARRRAAYTILKQKSKKIIGVYFQSQDGDNFYKQKSDLKKKQVKIVHGEVINQEADEMLPLNIVAQLQHIQQEEQKKQEEAKIQEEKKQENLVEEGKEEKVKVEEIKENKKENEIKDNKKEEQNKENKKEEQTKDNDKK